MTDFTVADLLAWARTKPADETYVFVSPAYCALGQFAREMLGFSELDAACEAYGPVSEKLLDAALGRFAIYPDFPEQNFGQLVKRLEMLVQEIPAKPTIWLTPQTYIDADCGKVPA